MKVKWTKTIRKEGKKDGRVRRGKISKRGGNR